MLKLPHNCTHLTLLITSWTYNVLLRPVQNFSCEIFLSPLPRVNPSFCVLPLHLTVFCNCFPILNTPYNKYFFILVHDLKNLNILESFFLGIFRKKKKLRDENEKRDSINSQEEQMLLQHCLFFFFLKIYLFMACGLSSCGAQAYLQYNSSCVASRLVGSSWTRDQTDVLCTGRQIINHWTIREAPAMLSWKT